MLLAIDIGNTNITFGVYKQDELKAAWRLGTAHKRMPDEYGLQFLGMLENRGFSLEQINGSVLASVVPPLTSTILQAVSQYLGLQPLVLDTGVKTGVHIKYEDPKAVGADRVADAAAVQALYQVPACVVDFGTATTFDAISDQGDYLGGAIAPGIGIAAEALFQRTAKLTRVDLAPPAEAIGRNTVTAMQSGLIYGYVGLVEGMVARFREELGAGMTVIATGGLAPLMAGQTAVIDHVDPWLTLAGLRVIWELNQEAEKQGQ
jgi:type III pantothenate kinase